MITWLLTFALVQLERGGELRTRVVNSFSVCRCFCLHGGVCPQMKSPLNPTPESICQLAACCHRVHVGGQSSWTGGQRGVRGRQGRRRPRAAAKCYFHYLLIQKSLSITESLNSNKSDLKITAAVIDRVAKPFFFPTLSHWMKNGVTGVRRHFSAHCPDVSTGLRSGCRM